MTTTAGKPHPIDHAILERAVAEAQGPHGASVAEIIAAYLDGAGGGARPYEIAATLAVLAKAGQVVRTKGPRGENLYLLPDEPQGDRVSLLESEKQQLQHALGVLSSAVTFATARLDQHDRREDQWRELLEANDEARRTLEATR